MHGTFFWYDLMTTDPTAAAKFYTEVVGWGTREVAGGEGYTAFTAKDQGVAGLMAVPGDVASRGGRPAWLGYVAVEDVDAAAVALEKAGGHVHRAPVTVPGIIRFAVVSDPQGATFYIAKGLPGDPPAPLPQGTPGTIGWRELLAGDGPSAFGFYETMFGWTKADAFDMGPMGTYQLFATGDAAVGGIMTKPDSVPQPHWGYYITVAAIDAAAERVGAAGGVIVMGPTAVPGGQWIVQCTDPQGAYFGLLSSVR